MAQRTTRNKNPEWLTDIVEAFNKNLDKKLVFSKGVETVISKKVNRKRKRHKFKLKIKHLLGYVTFCITCGVERSWSRRLKIKCQ